MKLFLLLILAICLTGCGYFQSTPPPETTFAHAPAAPTPTEKAEETETISLGSGLPTVRVRKGTKIFRSTTNELLAQDEPPCVTLDGDWSPITWVRDGSLTHFNATLDLSTPQSILPCYVNVTAQAGASDLSTGQDTIRLHVVAPTPTPTPTPSPTATPTPTPTPNHCQPNQYRYTGCICRTRWIGNPQRCKP